MAPKNSVIAREHEKEINGADLYRGTAYQHLESSQKGHVALGTRITKPSQAKMEDFEDRLREYDKDVEQYKRLTGNSIDKLPSCTCRT